MVSLNAVKTVPVYYKCFVAYADQSYMSSPYGADLEWHLPTRLHAANAWTPGQWMEPVVGPLELCKNGIHACELRHLRHWLNTRIFTLQYQSTTTGDFLVGDNKVCGRTARLLAPTRWDEQRARLFSADCATYVLPIFEQEHPNDGRVRDCIAVVRRYVYGQATSKELKAAELAALEAAWANYNPTVYHPLPLMLAWRAAGVAASAAYKYEMEGAVHAADNTVIAAPGVGTEAWISERLALYLHGVNLPAPYEGDN